MVLAGNLRSFLVLSITHKMQRKTNLRLLDEQLMSLNYIPKNNKNKTDPLNHGFRFIKQLAWLFAIVLSFLIVASRKHYTVDVVVAWYGQSSVNKSIMNVV